MRVSRTCQRTLKNNKKKPTKNPRQPQKPTLFFLCFQRRLQLLPPAPRLGASPSPPCPGLDRARLPAGMGWLSRGDAVTPTRPPGAGSAAGTCLGRKPRRRQHLRLRLSSPALHRREGKIYPAEQLPSRGKAAAGGAPCTPGSPETPPKSSGLPLLPRPKPPRHGSARGRPGERSPKRAGDGTASPRRVCLLIPGVIPKSGIRAGGR